MLHLSSKISLDKKNTHAMYYLMDICSTERYQTKGFPGVTCTLDEFIIRKRRSHVLPDFDRKGCLQLEKVGKRKSL